MEIVIVTAIWCPSCLIMRSRFEKVSHKFPNIDLNFYDIDMDEKANDYNVGNILPIFIVLQNDVELGRLVGEHKLDTLVQMVEVCINKKEQL